MISGSSVSNVVSGGIFTIPLMKKAGYGGVKAGAIETMSSVNGQIMPPVMGAAAFLMVEYVGIPYSEIVRNAILPATLSYIGLFYIVHLEALKLGMQPILQARAAAVARPRAAHRARHLGNDRRRRRAVLPARRHQARVRRRGALGRRASSCWRSTSARRGWRRASRTCRADIDIEHPKALDTWPAVAAGLHFLLPIGMLIWCLMVEEMSPSLSAFWAIVMLVVLMLTQRQLIAAFRRVPRAGARGPRAGATSSAA